MLVVIGTIVLVACSWDNSDKKPERHAAPATSAPSNWFLDKKESFDPSKASVWVDMGPKGLNLLDGARASDRGGTVRVDELDDDNGLTPADVEIKLLTEPKHGSLELHSSRGRATYIPWNTDFQGKDDFTYTLKLKGRPEVIRATQYLDLEWSPGERFRRSEPAQRAFATCADARAHGAAPIHRGDPGWGEHLDADGDGIGCERG
ncbi:excalibur calcium-binding domain-containing protein [Streptomyces sp. NPDC053048]|uniref:excalibur calcium-binding domain-containing protein n=1 Tax=Streptomyces sp. NPDC053048 TaxID=3365694 RepID=UPI0037D563B2